MKVWKKQTIRWTKNGKNVPRGTDGASKKAIESKRYYGSVTLSSGKRKQQALTESEKTSLEILVRLQNEEDKKRAFGVTKIEENRSKAVSDFLNEYETELRSRGNTEYHVTRTINNYLYSTPVDRNRQSFLAAADPCSETQQDRPCV